MRSTDGLPPDITALIAALDGDGLNTWGVAPAAGLGDVLPGARSVLVFGSGGGHLWRGFCTAIVENATTLTNHTHPFDSHVARCVAAADAVLDADRPRRWVLCGATEPGTAPPPFVDFRMLAREAGLGHPSRLGLLMGPVYGPWMGLRAACVLDDALDPTGPLPGDSPCLTCAAPCVPVCPVGAVPEVGARAPEDPRPLPFGIRRCAAHRASGDVPPSVALATPVPRALTTATMPWNSTITTTVAPAARPSPPTWASTPTGTPGWGPAGRSGPRADRPPTGQTKRAAPASVPSSGSSSSGRCSGSRSSAMRDINTSV